MCKMHENHSTNGLGHTKTKITYNSHSKYVDILDNRLYKQW